MEDVSALPRSTVLTMIQKRIQSPVSMKDDFLNHHMIKDIIDTLVAIATQSEEEVFISFFL